MKSTIPLLILLGFTAAALLGFAAMECGPHGCEGCLASLLTGTECPPGNPLASAAFHINAWQSTYTGIPNDALFLASILLLTGLLWRTLTRDPSKIHDILFAPLRTHTFHFVPLPIARRTQRWLAQHEHSPTSR